MQPYPEVPRMPLRRHQRQWHALQRRCLGHADTPRPFEGAWVPAASPQQDDVRHAILDFSFGRAVALMPHKALRHPLSDGAPGVGHAAQSHIGAVCSRTCATATVRCRVGRTSAVHTDPQPSHACCCSAPPLPPAWLRYLPQRQQWPQRHSSRRQYGHHGCRYGRRPPIGPCSPVLRWHVLATSRRSDGCPSCCWCIEQWWRYCCRWVVWALLQFIGRNCFGCLHRRDRKSVV